MEATPIFRASIFSGNEVLDTAKIQTAGQYISLHQIVRPLTQLNKQAQIVSNAIQSWEITDNGRIYDLLLSDNLLWSDGSQITVEDVINSINRQRKLNTSNHFDFSTIKEISKIDTKKIRIELHSRNSSFIRQMSYPEFGIVKIDNDSSLNLRITSGAYRLVNSAKDHFILAKNSYFPYHSSSSPRQIIIEWGDSEDKRKKAESKELDFFVPFSDFNKESLKKLTLDGYSVVTPHIGYSFWLSLNPNSQTLKDDSLREKIQVILKKTKIDFSKVEPFWIPADQIYLPDGLGRPSEEEINQIWSKKFDKVNSADKTLKLNLLLDNSLPFSHDIISQLKSHGFVPQVDWVNPKINIFNQIKMKEFDIIQVRNDFSSIDLYENLQTTFNHNNPLIITKESDNQYKPELLKSLNYETLEERSLVYKNIAKDIILKSYVVPLAYQKILFVHANKYDISAWSTLFPEISLWKIELKN